eukprot:COSAG02_NODE_2342_length_9101_cov_78.830038_2_plen_83_part_00
MMLSNQNKYARSVAVVAYINSNNRHGPAPPPTLHVWRHSPNGATPLEWRLNGGMAPNWRIGLLTAGLAPELSTAAAQVACVS